MIKWFKSIPLWLQIVIVIIIVYILYRIYRWIKTKAEAGNYNAAVSQSQDAIEQLAQEGINPSYGQAQYTSFANTIQQSLDGCGSGWFNMKEAFQAMKNDADIYALIKAYGVRSVDKCGLFTGDFNGDLSATLAYKFGGVEGWLITGSLSEINEILKKNGLSFQF